MLKNIFAFIGFAVITLIILVSVMGLGYFYDSIGLVNLPDGFPALSDLLPDDAVTVQPADPRPGKVAWTNPLTLLPSATATLPPTATPVPTVIPSPIPPLDPLLYRAHTMTALRELAANLELWMDANNRLSHDGSLLGQPDWRAQAQGALDRSAASAWSLAQVGPPPPEYAGIDALLDAIYAEVETLRGSYAQGIASGDPAVFRAAGESFERLRGLLTETAASMAQQGWAVE